jgi:DNA-binding CsgD family transcriptional regulator
LRNRCIARELGLSGKTVRAHVERIRRIVRGSTRGKAVARAREFEFLG